MSWLLAVSEAIERAAAAIARATGWLFVVCTLVICVDVLVRKAGYQIRGFGSTRLQELEWHLHTALLSLWLGFAYLRNAHVRVDVFTSRLGLRAQAWLELAGCLVLALPYCLVAFVYSLDYTWIAWVRNEASESMTGLPYRYIPKAVISLGFVLLLLAVLGVALRTVVYLWGPETLQPRSAFAGVKRRQG